MRQRQADIAHAKPDDAGSGNPDPTMRKPEGSPKGENMPPRGGEDISPAGEGRSPAESQKQVKEEAEAPSRQPS